MDRVPSPVFTIDDDNVFYLGGYRLSMVVDFTTRVHSFYNQKRIRFLSLKTVKSEYKILLIPVFCYTEGYHIHGYGSDTNPKVNLEENLNPFTVTSVGPPGRPASLVSLGSRRPSQGSRVCPAIVPLRPPNE